MAGKDLESQQTFDEPGLNFQFVIKPATFQWSRVLLRALHSTSNYQLLCKKKKKKEKNSLKIGLKFLEELILFQRKIPALAPLPVIPNGFWVHELHGCETRSGAFVASRTPSLDVAGRSCFTARGYRSRLSACRPVGKVSFSLHVDITAQMAVLLITISLPINETLLARRARRVLPKRGEEEKK